MLNYSVRVCMVANHALIEVIDSTRSRSISRSNFLKLINKCTSTRSRELHYSVTLPVNNLKNLSVKKDPKKFKIHQQPPVSGKFDLIGPPDPISNIRPIQFHVPSNETTTEKSFRLRRSEILQWNQNFWALHNSSFFKEKESYILNHQKTDSDGKTSISAEELSVFYKKFLDENRRSHLNYNREWYKQNISLLWPALKVALIRFKRMLERKS